MGGPKLSFQTLLPFLNPPPYKLFSNMIPPPLLLSPLQPEVRFTLVCQGVARMIAEAGGTNAKLICQTGESARLSIILMFDSVSITYDRAATAYATACLLVCLHVVV